MNKTIILFSTACLLIISSVSVSGFSTHSTALSRSFNKDAAIAGQPIRVAVSFTNLEIIDLRGFYYTEQIPLGLSISTVGVKINESNISYTAESGLNGEVYANYTPYRWILEFPPSFGENSPVSQNSTVEIVYTVTSTNAGAFSFEEFNWVGYYQNASARERAAFGYSENIDQEEITFTAPTGRLSEIIGSWDSGIWYWDVAVSNWTKMSSSPPIGDLTAGDFTGDGLADVASCYSSGLWYQNGATLEWTKVSSEVPAEMTAGDVTGDGRSEIIGSWSSGIWYWDVATSNWTKMSSSAPTGDIAAGDFTGDGRADVASCWSNGLWFQDGATLDWTKVSSGAPDNLTTGDVTGDGRSEIIGTWSSGIWYWDVATSNWTKMSASAPTGDIAAGDFTGDGRADVASCWSNGLWFQDGATLDWSKVSSGAPSKLTAGDVTGD